MTTDLCTSSTENGVAVLSFNRPDSMNGMTGDMEVAYFRRLLGAEADPAVRVIVVTGTGRAFCPGADLAHRPGPGEEPLPNASMARTIGFGTCLLHRYERCCPISHCLPAATRPSEFLCCSRGSPNSGKLAGPERPTRDSKASWRVSIPQPRLTEMIPGSKRLRNRSKTDSPVALTVACSDGSRCC